MKISDIKTLGKYVTQDIVFDIFLISSCEKGKL